MPSDCKNCYLPCEACEALVYVGFCKDHPLHREIADSDSVRIHDGGPAMCDTCLSSKPHECQQEKTGRCCGKCDHAHKDASINGVTPTVAQPQLNRVGQRMQGVSDELPPADNPNVNFLIATALNGGVFTDGCDG